MGKVNTRKRGSTWSYWFEAAKIDGKRNQVSKGGFRTKSEALEAGNKALTEYNNTGMSFIPSEISLSDYLEYWMSTYVKMNLKYNTMVAYRGIIDVHLKPRLGMYRLAAITPSAIQEFANDLKINGYSKSMTVNIISTLSGALNYAMEPLHYIKYNPCDRVKYPKFNEKPEEKRFIITTEQFNKIITRFPESSIFYIPLMIGWYTGMRLSEVFALTWDDIDFDERTISVNKIVVKRDQGIEARRQGNRLEKTEWYFGTPKTQSSNRVVTFGQSLYDVLKKHHNAVLSNQIKYGEYYTVNYLQTVKDDKNEDLLKILSIQKSIPVALPDSKLICVRESGEYVSTDSFKYCSRVIHHELNIQFNFHSLRHTHATLLIGNGANVKDVQMRLGHSKIETTLNTYTHDTQEMKRQSVDIFETVSKNVDLSSSKKLG